MPISRPTDTQFHSGFDTYKNFDAQSDIVGIPSQSYSALQVRKFTTVIPLVRTMASIQVLHNLSLFPTRYYIGNFLQIDFPIDLYSVQTRSAVSGTSLTVDYYIVNQSGISNTIGGFTITTIVKRFVSPY